MPVSGLDRRVLEEELKTGEVVCITLYISVFLEA